MSQPRSAEPAALPPAPWQRVPHRAARARREPITREAIVRTSLRLLDQEGLDAFSMRRIADELGTGAASLYWHVGSKDGLIDLLLEHVIGEVEVPEPQPDRWREQLKELARAQRAVILRHPDVVRLTAGRIAVGPNALCYCDRVLAIVRAGGLSDQLAFTGLQLLIATINGFTQDETAGLSRARATLQPSETPEMVIDYMASLPGELFPHLVEVTRHYAIDGEDERFDLLIDIFVEGLAARAGWAPHIREDPVAEAARSDDLGFPRRASGRRRR